MLKLLETAKERELQEVRDVEKVRFLS